VAETLKERAGILESKCFTMVDFPDPEGAAKTTNFFIKQYWQFVLLFFLIHLSFEPLFFGCWNH
jgi:hypothetical protein